LRQVAHLLLVCALFSSAEFGQAAQDSPSKVTDAVERVKQGNVGSGIVDASSYIEIIVSAGAVQAIPSLKEWFARSQDEEMKAALASALVRLRDPDNTYWDFLLQLAKPALESDAPSPFVGSKETAGVSPEFEAWAKANKLSIEEAAAAVLQLPQKLVPLAKTGDPRGIPLLRKALQSPNLLIQTTGAVGLAKAQDKGAVPLIIEACKKAPPNMASFIADSLIYFDDPQARSEFHRYFPDVDIDQAKQFRGSDPWRRPSHLQ
jgi:HEAT repeat protein